MSKILVTPDTMAAAVNTLSSIQKDQLRSSIMPPQGTSAGMFLTTNGSTLAWAPTPTGTAGGSGTVTSVNATSSVSGLTFTGGPITSSGTLTLSGTLGVANGGTGTTSISGILSSLLPAQVGSAGMFLTTNGSTLAWATPASGTTGGSGTVTSVNATSTTGLTFTGGPITTTGTLTLAGTLSVANGGTGTTSISGLLAALLPTQSGSAGMFLTTNGSTLSWGTPAGGTGGPTSASGITYNPGYPGSVTYTAESKMREIRSVRDFGAKSDGSTNDSAAVGLALASSGVVYFPYGKTITNTPMSASGAGLGYGFFTLGGEFGGSYPMDGKFPAFGPAVGRFFAMGNRNSLIGVSHNDSPAGTFAMPTGTTGYGLSTNSGNAVFGLFGRADLGLAGSPGSGIKGCVTNEVNSFNFSGPPSTVLPPSRAIPNPYIEPIALTVASGGSYNSSIGIQLVQEGAGGARFLTGMYVNPDTCTRFGIMLDASATDTHVPILAKHSTSTIGIQVQGVGTASPNGAWMTYVNSSGTTVFAAKQSGKLMFTSGIIQTSHGVAGAAATLPSNPTGYLQIEIDGITKVIPYYEP